MGARTSLNNLMGIAVLLLPLSANASLDQPLPPVDEIVKRALERGDVEPENERLFNQRYYYVRSRQTAVRNSDGDLKKLKIKIATNAPSGLSSNAPVQVQPAGAPAGLHSPKQMSVTKNGGPSEKTEKFEKEEHLKFGKELVKRYDFKLVGRVITNGCSLLVVDFTPKNEKLPEKDLRDRVVNRMAGRIWLDEREYAVKCCAVRLTRKLAIVGGIVGEAHKFNYMFDRERTEDGLWYVRESKWQLEGRQVVVQREADYHETRTDVRKYIPPTESAPE